MKYLRNIFTLCLCGLRDAGLITQGDFKSLDADLTRRMRIKKLKDAAPEPDEVHPEHKEEQSFEGIKQ